MSANRGTEPKKLTGLLRNELDWIVMKALEKDRSRRYETANGFAADVLRYLGGEPVQAHPPSTAYRLKKFVRRNRGQVIATGLVLFALLAGIIGTTLGLIEAKRQEQIAREETSLKEVARQAESARAEAEAKERQRAEAGEKLAGERLVQVEHEKKKAEDEKAIALAVKDFLQNLLRQADVTAQVDRLALAGRSTTESKTNPTIRELLDRAAEELTESKIEAVFPGQPSLQAEILFTLGSAYRGIGEYKRSIGLLQRSLTLRKTSRGPEHPKTLECMRILALSFSYAGDEMHAPPLLEEVVRIQKVKLGPENPENTVVPDRTGRRISCRRKAESGRAIIGGDAQTSQTCIF